MAILISLHSISLCFIISKINSKFNAGSFYGKRPNNLLDFKHFEANELIFMTNKGFRDLPYYTFSSDRYYFQYFFEFQPKALLFTQSKTLRSKGLSEYVFHNYLQNPYIKHFELGYGLGFLGGAASVEVFSSFTNQTYQKTAFRIVLPLNVKKFD